MTVKIARDIVIDSPIGIYGHREPSYFDRYHFLTSLPLITTRYLSRYHSLPLLETTISLAANKLGKNFLLVKSLSVKKHDNCAFCEAALKLDTHNDENESGQNLKTFCLLERKLNLEQKMI